MHDPLDDHFSLAAKVIFDPWLIVYMDVETSAGDGGSNDNSTTSTSGSRSNSGSGTSGPAGVVTIGHTEMAHLRRRVPAPRPCNSFHRIIKGRVGAAGLAAHFRNSPIDRGTATAIVHKHRSGTREHIVRVLRGAPPPASSLVSA
ncbi:hypothetical protein GCM10010294_24820 [Streptomyces griseoloalbus]|nr:hypothetical protein GCM10010294_24820 [Streptomyces griseoloalbus]